MIDPDRFYPSMTLFDRRCEKISQNYSSYNRPLFLNFLKFSNLKSKNND